MSNPKRNILIVDDDDAVRFALEMTLKSEGHNVIAANGPEQGLQFLRSMPIDMVISDQTMPLMSGLEFLKLVRDRHPDVMRIMLTGNAEMNTVIDAINHGEIYRFLTKPWDSTELKVMLYVAFEQLDLERENRQLLSQVRFQDNVLRALEKKYPGVSAMLKASPAQSPHIN